MYVSYYLMEDGHSVTVVDTNSKEDRTSVNNAGFITPSFGPSPIALSRMLGAAIRPSGALYFSLREVVKDIPWFRMGLSRGMTGYEDVLSNLGQKSLGLYDEFFRKESVQVDLQYGVAALFSLEERAKKAAELVKGKFLGTKEIGEMGYVGFGGGAYLDSQVTVNPAKLFSELRRVLEAEGAKMMLGKNADLTRESDTKAQLKVDGETVSADAYVIAAGARTRRLGKDLGYDPKILPARGMAMVFDTGGEKIIDTPAFFVDEGISLGQHNKDTFRMTSFFELKGFDTEWNESRREWFLKSAKAHIPAFDKMKLVEEGTGFRPCTPDQIPVVGQIPGYSNAWVASGTCREGVILAPITGRIVASMIAGKTLSDLPIQEISPARFK